MLSGVKPLPTEDLRHILEYTRTLWESIFISAARFFFGPWLLESLASSNREFKLDLKATVLSRNPDAFLNRLPFLSGESSIEWLRGDVRTFDFPEGQSILSPMELRQLRPGWRTTV
jgi:dTDP-glucose 4,6-dehydratase